MEKQAIGNLISPMLGNYENLLWEWEAKNMGKTHFTKEGFRSALKIFICAAFDKMQDLQQAEEMSQKDIEAMNDVFATEIRKFIKMFTGINTHELW